LWDLYDSYKTTRTASDAFEEATKKNKKATRDFNKALKTATNEKQAVVLSESIVHLAQGITGLVSAFSMLNNVWQILKDPDVSGWEKFTTVIMSLASFIPTVVSAIKGLKDARIIETMETIGNTIATITNTKAKERNAKAAQK
jgi:oligoendopeptidase F